MAAVEIVFVLLLVLVVVAIAAGARTVPQGQVWTVERFGAFTREIRPGRNRIVAYIGRVGRRMEVQERVLDIPEPSVIIPDNATTRQRDGGGGRGDP